MADTSTTHATVAARLTDEEILYLAELCFFTSHSAEEDQNTAAVLRDYVRLRKLANAVKVKFSECNMLGSYAELKYEGELPYTSKILKSVADIKLLLAEMEKSENENK